MTNNLLAITEILIKITYLLLCNENNNQDEEETIAEEHDGIDKSKENVFSYSLLTI